MREREISDTLSASQRSSRFPAERGGTSHRCSPASAKGEFLCEKVMATDSNRFTYSFPGAMLKEERCGPSDQPAAKACRENSASRRAPFGSDGRREPC